MNRKRLGELMMDAGLLDGNQLQAALAHQQQWGGRIGRVVVQLGIVPEHRMVRILADHLGVPVADPPPDDINPRILAELTGDLAARCMAFPIALRRDVGGDAIVVAMADPTNGDAVAALQAHTGKRVHIALVGDIQVEAWIRRHYFAPAAPQQNAADQDDDIPLVTGAIVGTPAPFPVPPQVAAANPFAVPGPAIADLAPVAIDDPFSALHLTPIEVPGSPTSSAMMGVAELQPLPASSAAPVFDTAGGYLGADDDDGALPPPPETPFAPPSFAATPPPPPPPPVLPAAAPDPFSGMPSTVSMFDGAMPMPTAAPPPPPGPSWAELVDGTGPGAFASPAPAPTETLVPPATTLVAPPETAGPRPAMACSRCAAPRVDGARFCPFCGLSFVAAQAPALATAPSTDAMPTPIATGVLLDLGSTGLDPASVDEPAPIDTGPPAAATSGAFDIVVLDAEPADSGALEVVEVDAGTSDVVDAGPAPTIQTEDMPTAAMSLVRIDAAPPVFDDLAMEPLLPATAPAPPGGADPADADPPDAAPAGGPAPGIEVIALAGADPGAPPTEAAIEAILVDVAETPTLELVAVHIEEPADTSLAEKALANQWADAAERPIPRQETDTRNALGWVPPSREILTVPEPAPPPPEPLVAYAPAAPAAPVSAAPWARFAVGAAAAPAAVVTPAPRDFDVEVADTERVERPDLTSEVGPSTSDDAGQPSSGASGWSLSEPARVSAAGPGSVAPPTSASSSMLADSWQVPADAPAPATVEEPSLEIPTPFDLDDQAVPAVEIVVDDVDVDVAPEDLPVSSDAIGLELAPVESMDAGEFPTGAPGLMSLPVEELALGDIGLDAPPPLPVPAEDMGFDLAPLDAPPPLPSPAESIGFDLAPLDAPPPSPAESIGLDLVPLDAPPPSPAESIGLDLVPLDAPPPLPVPAGNSGLDFVPLDAPPPMPLSAQDIGFDLAPIDAPPAMPMPAADVGLDLVAVDDISVEPLPPELSVDMPELAAWPDAEGPPAIKLTPTMVMRMDPAEQRRLLAVLLEKANVGPEVLSSMPGDPDKPKT